MPRQPTVAEVRLTNITTCLNGAANTYEILADSFKAPFSDAICNTTQSLMKCIQTVKQNKDNCSFLMEQAHELLNAIIIAHIKSDTGAELPPSVLNQIGIFTEYLACHEPAFRTLHKIHNFVEAQQEGSKVKSFFHLGEMSSLLKECKAGLQQGLDFFQIKTINVMKDATKMQEDANKRHKEVLDMIEALSDTSSDGASSISRVYSGSHNSSNSISMLPSEPKIFHGRELELLEILQVFSQGTPRVAILGAGGMGKTSLARAVIHHTEIAGRYEQHRFFVACDLAVTQVELAALIGSHLGLKPAKDLTRPVIQHFTRSPPSLLILDNLETLWDSTDSRGKIEEFLSLLTDVEHLALVPLKQDAARQTFIDIVDTTHDLEEVDKVLSLTDNMPLAISLLAHLVDTEGCSNVLSRWEKEKTSLISDGYDRRSNLDLSISLSLSSPRLNSFPHSKDLLSLLSMLPDGLSDADLVQSELPIDNILGCKAALIRTTLAYSDEHKQLKALVPIREYMQKIQPPGDCLVQPLLRYFQELLEFCIKYHGTQLNSSTVARVSSHYSNIQNIVQNGLQQGTYYGFQDDISPAKKYCETAISLAVSNRNTKNHCTILIVLAWINKCHGEYFTAQVYAKEAQRLARITANLFQESEALLLETICWTALGNYEQSLSLSNTARDLLNLCGLSGGELDGSIMVTQAEIHKFKSEYVEARSIHTSLPDRIYADQNIYDHSFALLNIAEIDVSLGAPKDDVQRSCDTAKRMFNTTGFSPGVVMCETILADLYLREGNMLNAKNLLKSCIRSSSGNSDIISYCLERLGNASRWGAPNLMSKWTTVFLVHSVRRKERLGIYKALEFFGDVFLAQGDEHTATSLFTVALDGFTKMGVHRSRAECMIRLGDISKEHGNLLKAVELWGTARPLFERSSQVKEVKHVDERLTSVSEHVLEQHRKNLARLAELSVPSTAVEEMDGMSDIEDMEGLDDEKELDLVAV
ncbi:hypothetical protein B0H13DRAFT_1891878 [Mycena leptocephala]|nr:hypothetical protein B0H13DRAFT_1891878 [Mycena leptocephala]